MTPYLCTLQVALRHGDLPVQLSDNAVAPVRWRVPGGPQAMDCKAFCQSLALLFEGERGPPACTSCLHLLLLLGVLQVQCALIGHQL